MEYAILTITAALVLGAAFVLFRLRRDGNAWTIAVHPYTYVLILYIAFFRFQAATGRSSAELVDLCIATSVVVFSAGFWAASMSIPSPRVLHFADRVLRLRSPFRCFAGVRRTTVSVAVLVSCWLLLFWTMRIAQYGSFINAATAMYARTGEEPHRLFRFLIFDMYPFVAVVIAYLAHVILTSRNSRGLLVLLGLALVTIVSAATTGTRGRVLLVPLMITLAMLTVRQTRIRPSRLASVAVLALLIVGGSLFVALTDMRGRRFDGILEMTRATGASLGSSPNTGQSAYDSLGRAPNVVAECLEMYGRQEKHYGLFYTPYVIAVNPVPRMLWPGKPLAFGNRFVLERHSLTEAKVSYAAGTFGEGYAAWGFAGGFLYSLLFGAVAGACAKAAMSMLRGTNVPFEQFVLALMFWGWSCLFVRGDMLSAWAFGFYPVVFLIVAVLVLKRVPRVGQRSCGNPREQAPVTPT